MQIAAMIAKTPSRFYKGSYKSPLGGITAVFAEKRLVMLAFENTSDMQVTTHLPLKKTTLSMGFLADLQDYFCGKKHTFDTPYETYGTPFQKAAWNALACVPYGTTKSYAEQAESIGRPKAFRAVALANGANLLPIVLPCHRIVRTSGRLGGYRPGLHYKTWLLAHEAHFKQPI